jgi:hypothetical protein
MWQKIKISLSNFFGGILHTACCSWSHLHDLGQILKFCRFSLITLLVGVSLFGFADQGKDVIRAVVESWHDSIVRTLVFFAAVSFWVFSMWYWSRQVLRLENYYIKPRDAIHAECLLKFRRWTPRLIGFVGYTVIAWTFYSTAQTYAQLSDTANQRAALQIAGLAILIGVLFVLFAIMRLNVQSKISSRFKRQGHMDTRLSKREYHAATLRIKTLPGLTKWLLLLSTGLTIGLLILFTLDPLASHRVHLPIESLVLLAAGNWVPLGFIATYIGDQIRLPIMTSLLILAVLFSAINDNHEVKFLNQYSPERLTIQQHFPDWFALRYATWKANNGETPMPVFVVAAEGGGIRAAYWTANVLGALQDNNPEFANHIYAMSGVSGGSLGIATFSALVKRNANTMNCERDDAIKNGITREKAPYRDCAHAILSRDFLTPTASRMLYGDLLQRFLPFAVSSFDRGQALESSWTEAWKTYAKQDDFSQPFNDLWRKDPANNVPALFLNSTWVETGRRVISSHLQLDDHFTTVVDFDSRFRKSIALSTAVHNSARFTYVSPAGKILVGNQQQTVTWGHLVDGGYFENSGATTALEILRAMQDAAGSNWQHVQPVVLMITNEPGLNDCSDDDPGEVWANEVMSPLRALLNTRGARGSYSRGDLYSFVTDDEQGHFVHLGIHADNDKKVIPLGWALSDLATTTMHNRATEIIAPFHKNDPLNKIGSALGTAERFVCKP